MNVNFVTVTSFVKSSFFFFFQTRTLTDAKVDARTFSHAEARAKQCIRELVSTFGEIVMHLVQVLEE